MVLRERREPMHLLSKVPRDERQLGAKPKTASPKATNKLVNHAD